MTVAARFCAACGTALVPGARFCAGCGAAVAAAPALPAGERREVTVLFADLAAFTRLSAGRDPEDMHRLLNRLFAVLDRTVVEHGGTVDKHMGDAVMALFGAPIAHGDDPLRAVRTAIALHAAVAELGALEGLPLALHIGIHGGEVVASAVGGSGHESYTVTGDAVNIAARLQDLATAGETLISDGIHRAIAGRVQAQPLGQRSLRGIGREIPVWRVLATEPAEGGFGRTPFIGRTREKRQVAAALDACLEDRRGGVILIRGEAGIGKTRLVEAVDTLAGERGMTRHRTLVLDFGVGKGRDPIPALVRGLLGLAADAAKGERAERAAAALGDGVIGADLGPHLHDLLDLPQPQDQRARFDAMDSAARRRGIATTVAALARRMADANPRLLVVEDVHWADAAALAHMAELAAVSGEAPLVLVMTTRIEGDPIDHGWRAAARGGPVTTIDLAPLRPDEAYAMASALDREHDDAVRACIARAEGNPLYLEQLIRNLAEQVAGTLPPSLQSLVLARMDRLPASDKAALQAASVIGQRFSLDLLRAVTEDPTYEPGTLIRHALVRPEGDEFLFGHALIRDGVYSSLLNASKKVLHGRAAQWYAGRDAPLHAQHLERAGDAGAAAAYAAAASQAADAYRHDGALDLAERGLAIAATAADRHALLLLKGRILHDLSRPADSVAAYQAALAEAADDPARGRALLGIAAGHRMTGSVAEASEALDAARAALVGDDLAIERARLNYLQGNIAFARGDPAICEARHTEALAWAEKAGSIEFQARALSGIGDAFYARGRMLTAHRSFDRCIRLAREHGLGRVELANRFMLGFTYYYQCDLEAARSHHDAVVVMARAVGDLNQEMIGYESRAEIGYELGDSVESLADARRGEAIARSIGAKRYLSVLLGEMARILFALGRRDEAERAIEESLELCRATSMRFFAPVALGILAQFSADDTRREAALAEAEALLAEGCVSHNYFWFYRCGMEAALTRGEADRALRYAAALEDYTRAEPLPWSDFWIARCRALVAGGDGEARTELQRLRDFAEEHRLRSALPALDAALAGQALETTRAIRPHMAPQPASQSASDDQRDRR